MKNLLTRPLLIVILTASIILYALGLPRDFTSSFSPLGRKLAVGQVELIEPVIVTAIAPELKIDLCEYPKVNCSKISTVKVLNASLLDIKETESFMKIKAKRLRYTGLEIGQIKLFALGLARAEIARCRKLLSVFNHERQKEIPFSKLFGKQLGKRIYGFSSYGTVSAIPIQLRVGELNTKFDRLTKSLSDQRLSIGYTQITQIGDVLHSAIPESLSLQSIDYRWDSKAPSILKILLPESFNSPAIIQSFSLAVKSGKLTYILPIAVQSDASQFVPSNESQDGETPSPEESVSPTIESTSTAENSDNEPTSVPEETPTEIPTETPDEVATEEPISTETAIPTETMSGTESPTVIPTAEPTAEEWPTAPATELPEESSTAFASPTDEPTSTPVYVPSSIPEIPTPLPPDSGPTPIGTQDSESTPTETPSTTPTPDSTYDPTSTPEMCELGDECDPQGGRGDDYCSQNLGKPATCDTSSKPCKCKPDPYCSDSDECNPEEGRGDEYCSDINESESICDTSQKPCRCKPKDYCGDGAVGEGEQCDDANEEEEDGCDSSCRYNPCCSCYHQVDTIYNGNSVGEPSAAEFESKCDNFFDEENCKNEEQKRKIPVTVKITNDESGIKVCYEADGDPLSCSSPKLDFNVHGSCNTSFTEGCVELLLSLCPKFTGGACDRVISMRWNGCRTGRNQTELQQLVDQMNSELKRDGETCTVELEASSTVVPIDSGGSGDELGGEQCPTTAKYYFTAKGTENPKCSEYEGKSCPLSKDETADTYLGPCEKDDGSTASLYCCYKYPQNGTYCVKN